VKLPRSLGRCAHDFEHGVHTVAGHRAEEFPDTRNDTLRSGALAQKRLAMLQWEGQRVVEETRDRVPLSARRRSGR
jgi:hypothetical protein